MEEDKNQSTVQKPVEPTLQNSTNEQNQNQSTTEVKKDGQEKEGLEQHGSIKNTK